MDPILEVFVERVASTGAVLEPVAAAHDAATLGAKAIVAFRETTGRIDLEFFLFEDQEGAVAAARALEDTPWTRAPFYDAGISGPVLVLARICDAADLDDRRDQVTGMLTAFAGKCAFEEGLDVNSAPGADPRTLDFRFRSECPACGGPTAWDGGSRLDTGRLFLSLSCPSCDNGVWEAMELRLDRVIRVLMLGFKKVYSLVLDDKGLYVIRTGNVGALMELGTPIPNPTQPGSVVGTALGMSIAGKILSGYAQQLVRGEARLSNTPLDQLAREKGNVFVALSEIRSVAVKPTKAPGQLPPGPATEMKLKTERGDFRFVFTHTPAKQVKGLEEALKRGKAG